MAKTEPGTPIRLSSPRSVVPRNETGAFDKPWHAHLTLDLILHVLSRSVFHPFICFLVPLCLRAQLTPYSHPAFVYTTAWAGAVSLWWLLAIVNHRVAYGRPRQVRFGNEERRADEEDEEEKRAEEVVLITGGCNGLGRLLAEIFGLRGIGVAVLDIREPEGGREKMEEEEGWRFYECDVGNWEDVERVKTEVERDVCIILPSHCFSGKKFVVLLKDSSRCDLIKCWADIWFAARQAHDTDQQCCFAHWWITLVLKGRAVAGQVFH